MTRAPTLGGVPSDRYQAHIHIMLLVRMASSGHLERVETDVASSDRQVYSDYVAAVERVMSASAYARAPRRADFVVDRDGNRSVVCTPQPTDEELDVLLHRMRPLILQSEPFSFLTVANRVGVAFQNPVLRRFLRAERDRFSGVRWREMWEIVADGMVLNSDDLFRKWLNGLEYHRDPEKRTEIETLTRTSMPGLFPWVRTAMLFEKIKAVSNLADFLRVALGRTFSFEYDGWIVERYQSGA
ncbi:MAG: hypothetical protein ACTHQM_26120 [Thermoanaerobaculia bacterium]